jgi:precorrin-2 dehydrogenase / sirohydrochlorin ferrochelatase
MPKYYPVMLDVRGREVLVIGGNSIAAEKAEALSGSGARVTIMSEEFGEEVKELEQRKRVTLWHKGYERGDLRGFFVVVAVTTYDPITSEVIWNEGQENNQLINIVDFPTRCNFIVPSLLRRGQLTIAVSTEGSSPGLAKRIRQKLESEFPSAYEGYLRLATIIRGYMRAQGLSYGQRDDFFGDFFASDVLQLLNEEREDEAIEATVELLRRYNVRVEQEQLEQDVKETDGEHENILRA